MTDFHVEWAHWHTDRARLLAVREIVFVQEQGVPPELEADDQDALSEHVKAVSASGEIVGTARLLRDGHIGRMAVLGDWRGRGVGSAMLRWLVERARSRGHRQVCLNAQSYAIGFYQRFGFVCQGEEFIDAGIAHRAMARVF